MQKPELSAPGAFVAAAMSADADPRVNPGGIFDLGGCPPGEADCALLDNTHALAAGTSMSAPHVTGAAALLMELDPTLTQARLTEVLQAGARLSQGHIPDPDQLGPGSLDVEGARQALLDTMDTPSAPSLSRSWYTLSSAYARPDPTWPVWGTVELRKGDGTPASGLDGTSLALSLQGGGTVYQPLTKVRQGLWRFAVAGRLADLGGTLVVSVTYGGVSLGQQTLPVGYDAWTASDPAIDATGACSCTAAGGQAPERWPGWMALALAAMTAVRGMRLRGRRGGSVPTLPSALPMLPPALPTLPPAVPLSSIKKMDQEGSPDGPGRIDGGLPPETLRIERVPLQPALHLHPRLPHLPGHGGHVAPVLAEEQGDLLPLLGVRALANGRAGGGGLHGEGEVLEVDRARGAGEHDGAAQALLQLPHVAGPAVAEQGPRRTGAERRRRRVGGGEAREEDAGEQAQVLAAGA